MCRIEIKVATNAWHRVVLVTQISRTEESEQYTAGITHAKKDGDFGYYFSATVASN